MSDTVERTLGRVEAKLDMLCESVQAHMESPHVDPTRVEDLFQAVAGLNRLKWMFAGAVALLSAGVALAKVFIG